jgi:hypothetical protein
MIGRPINPHSERQTRPWEAYRMSRAWYYILKKYGDLPVRRYHHRKLTPDDVRYIKRFFLERPYREHKWLLVDFDVCWATLQDIFHERTWKHIQP